MKEKTELKQTNLTNLSNGLRWLGVGVGFEVLVQLSPGRQSEGLLGNGPQPAWERETSKEKQSINEDAQPLVTTGYRKPRQESNETTRVSHMRRRRRRAILHFYGV